VKATIAALIELASRGTGQWVKAEGLSKSIGEDPPFLMQIMNRMVQQGIVRSKRGRQGGFQIAVSPNRLSLAQVVSAVEGSNLTKRCLFSSDPCDGARSCVLAPSWHPIREMLLDFLNRETIQTVAKRGVERFDIGGMNEQAC